MLTDPEINAALAERAEGWKRESGIINQAHWVLPGGDIRFWCPDYMTDPAASQRLKEAMRKLGWYDSVCGGPTGAGGIVCARFFRFYPLFKEGNNGDPSEIRAVALAAARALGIEGI